MRQGTLGAMRVVAMVGADLDRHGRIALDVREGVAVLVVRAERESVGADSRELLVLLSQVGSSVISPRHDSGMIPVEIRSAAFRQVSA
jgi:hypothetical protein